MKSLGYITEMSKCHWCGYVEHGLEYFSFHVQKYIAYLAASSVPPLVRDRTLGAPAFLKLVYSPNNNFVTMAS